MTSLFIFFVHGSLMATKIVKNSTRRVGSMVTLCVFYDDTSEEFIISGCRVIDEYMVNEDRWFRKGSKKDRLSVFKQLVDALKARYCFPREKIYTSFEGNWTVLAGSYLSPVVVDSINHVSPWVVFLPTGTVDCCKFINYWMTYHDYPRFELDETINLDEHYYQEDELSAEKRAELDKIADSLPLTCHQIPFLATFHKACLPKAISIILDRHESHLFMQVNSEMREIIPSDGCNWLHQLTACATQAEDNRVYRFHPIAENRLSAEDVSTMRTDQSSFVGFVQDESGHHSSGNFGTKKKEKLERLVSLRESNLEHFVPIPAANLDNHLDQTKPLNEQGSSDVHAEKRTWFQFFSACCFCSCRIAPKDSSISPKLR